VRRKIIDFSIEENEYVSQISIVGPMAERKTTFLPAFTFIKGGRLVGSSLIQGALSESESQTLNVFLRAGTKNGANNLSSHAKDFIDLIDIESCEGFEVALRPVANTDKIGNTTAEISITWIESQESDSKLRYIMH